MVEPGVSIRSLSRREQSRDDSSYKAPVHGPRISLSRECFVISPDRPLDKETLCLSISLGDVVVKESIIMQLYCNAMNAVKVLGIQAF